MVLIHMWDAGVELYYRNILVIKTLFFNKVILSLIVGSLIYEKLGEKAFGWPGKMGAFTSIIMQNIGGKGI